MSSQILYPESDETRFLLFKAGNEKVFEKIFKERYNALAGFCYQFIKDEDKARSIAQEAFIRLWINRGKIEKQNGVFAFLYTAAKSECLNYLRHQKVISRYADQWTEKLERDFNHSVLESFNFGVLEFEELEKSIARAVEELPERCRMVFVKSRLEGKKNQEIADEMGIALKSVEASMTRALKILREKLSDFLVLIFAMFFY